MPMARDLRFPLVLACFFGSGFAALVYETAWTRQFAFVFGSSELAVATVLAGYMAGLALGSLLAARLAPRIRRPVLAYAILELGIALTALCIPAALRGARALYVAVFTGADLADQGGLGRSLFYLACSFLILVVPTALMGATLPLLARYAVRRDDELGRRIGILYTVNTLGAVAGTVVAAFVLLPALGLAGSVSVAVAANVAVFLGGALLARGTAPVATAREPAAPGPPAGGPGLRAGLILPVMLLSGSASFAYEVLWTRLLSHVLGGSVYAFATMLAAFLAGIALGAALASRLATDRARAAGAFAWAQAGTAALSIAAFYSLDAMPGLVLAVAGAGGGRLVSDALVAGLVLLPGTICIGATFPLAVRILAPDERAATAASARVYAWNTVGAVAGAVGTGFLLLPCQGFAGTLRLAAALNLLLALATVMLVARLPRRLPWAAAAAIVVLAVVPLREPWNILRSSPLQGVPAQGLPAFYAVGRGATVLLLDHQGAWELGTNGLPEAIIQPRGGIEVLDIEVNWLGALPCLARPDARRMMVVGLGGGVLAESVPATIERIDLVEIEPEVVAANRAVADERARDPLADPRVRVIVNDARDALTLSRSRYGVIASQPSHPWTAGSANLYTREFLALARDHLEPGGVMAQWMQLRFVDTDLFRSIIATLRSVFAHVRVYRPSGTGVVFLASDVPFDMARSVPAALAADPPGYARLDVGCLEDVESALALDEAAAAAMGEGAELITDDRNVLAMRSPAVARGAGERWRGVVEAMSPHDPLRRDDPALERDRVVRRLLRSGFRDRAAEAAARTVNPAMRALCQAWVAVAAADLRRAQELVEQALSINPRLRAARLLRLEIARAQGAALPPDEDGLLDVHRAVLEGWTLSGESDWTGLRSIDGDLAAAPPCDPWAAVAVRLRVEWRLRDGDPALAAEALGLLDPMLAGGRAPSDMLLRARVAVAARAWRGVITTLFELLIEQQPLPRPLAQSALDLVDAADRAGAPEGDLAPLRAALLDAVRAAPAPALRVK
jgi:spermidine synthase